MTHTAQTTTLNKQKIVAKSTPIFERIEKGFVSASTNNDKVIIARLQKWRDAFSDKDETLLAKRLAWEGHTPDTVRALLGEVVLPENYPLPEWVSYLEEALAMCQWLSSRPLYEHQAVAKEIFKADEPLPYEDVLFPFVLAAQKALRASAGQNYNLLTDHAHAALTHSLLKRLTTISAHCLELEFSITRLTRQTNLSRLLQSDGPPQKELYQSFAQRMITGGMVAFLEEYTVLARLIGTAMALWVTATGEFLQRLADDYDSICNMFYPDAPAKLGQVIKIETDLSDPHNQGRTVIILTFMTGLKLVYKPKNLGVEESYYQLMAWLNKKEVFPPFKIFKIINRGNYGWCEFVAHLPCQDEAEVKRYYQRAGILVAWLYSLEATDCHYENIIACSEHPVLIDLETIIHQRSLLEVQHDEDNTESQFLAHQYLWQSVFRTGFLPQWQFNKNGKSYDGSGLASSDDQVSIVKVPHWESVNTDSMHLSVDLYQARTRVNVPHLNGKVMPLDNYIEDFVLGFRQAYQFILENRALILSSESPLPTLFAQSVRHIFRNTSNYVSTMEGALHPKFLRNGADRTIALDGFNDKYVAEHDTKPPFWAAIVHERASMEILDIPFFKTEVISRDLADASGETVVKDHFANSAAALVQARFAQLSQEDLERQTSFIRASLYSRVTRPSGQGDAQVEFSSRESMSPISAVEMVTEAKYIADELNRQAIHASDGSISWVALGYIEYAQKYRLQPIDYDFYNGSAGIGVFLAALAHVTGEDRYRQWAKGALLLLRQHLQNETVSQKMARRIGIGAATGIGSLIYALVKSSQFLADPELLLEAKAAAALISSTLIAQDTHLDVARGSAGAILGLLALYESTGDVTLLETANACAAHLQRCRVMSKGGYLVWANHSDQLLTGILHGAAGYAYALLRLYAHTARPELLEMAEEAIEYETSLFSPTQQNWLVYEGATPLETMTTWCHGAPGIGLARLGCLRLRETAVIRQDIQVALNTTEQLGLTGIDHLCCGNFGRMELLLKASQILGSGELAQKAQQWATWSVNRMRETGNYHFSPDIPRDVYQPALFTGTSGIGYALLRLANPTLLPSIMLWE